MSDTPVRGRHLTALRAVALHPRGLRLSAHPVTMRALVELGYVAEKPARYAGRRRDETARRLVEEMRVHCDASVLYRASVAFSFSRHFVVRNTANRSEDFAPVLEMAAQAASLATAETLSDCVHGLTTALSQAPGVVRVARGRRTVIKPLSAASYMVWLLRPEVGAVYDEPLLAAVRSYGYIVAKGDYPTYLAAYRTERSKREAELQAALATAGMASESGRLSQTVFETWLRQSAAGQAAARMVEPANGRKVTLSTTAGRF